MMYNLIQNEVQNPVIKKVLVRLYILTHVLVVVVAVLGTFSIYAAVNMAHKGYYPGLNNLDPIPADSGVLTQGEIIDLMFTRRFHKLSFDFHAVKSETFGGYVSGRTSCGDPSFLYTYESSQGYLPQYEVGVWIEVTECGMEAHEAFDQIGFQTSSESVADIYMPLAALEDVRTFEDYEAAIRQYGVVYRINQPLFAAVLGIDSNTLPVNQQLPKP